MAKKKPRCTACQSQRRAYGLHGFCRRCWNDLPVTMRQRFRAGRFKHSQGRFVRPEKETR